MTDRELMKQALEALEEINKLSIGENAIFLPAEIDGAMDALRKRLAQPEQEHIKALEDAVAAERERCAELCDSIAANAVLGTANECAAAIRELK